MQASIMETRLERLRTIFSANLKERMHEKGLNQSDLARAIWSEVRTDSRGYEQPVNKDRISAWTNGRVLPNLENLQKLAIALDTTPEDLLPELETTILTKKHDHSRPASDYELDFVFRIDGGYAVVQIKCRLPLEGAQELVAVYAKHIKDMEHPVEPSDPGRSSEALASFYTHDRKASR